MDRIEEPKNRRSRRTRSALLDAAWQLIEERGPGAVTIEEVAHTAGVSRRSFYLHFSSRIELLACLREHMDEALDIASSIEPMRRANDAGELIQAWARHVAEYHARIRPIVQAIDRARPTDEAAAVVYEGAMEEWHRGCRRIAERLAAEDRLAAPWTVETAADLLWALMSVDLLEDLVEERGWTTGRYAEMLAMTALRTLTRRD